MAENATALCCDCCAITDRDGAACAVCGSARIVAHIELETLGIAHIDCDAFYASVEKRDRPEIRRQPLIVGHAGGRGVVTTACYIARKYGVRSAMPMWKALEACPDAVVIAPDMAKYKRVSNEIRAIFYAATSVFEPVSLDEAYLDLTDDWRTEAPPAAEALALVAARVEAEVGITVSIGLAPNKFLAKLASERQKPRGFSVIGQAEAKAFLSPLAVSKINGVGAATAARMEAEGLHTIGDLQELSEQQLTAHFGKFGHRLFQFAHGNDDRAVTPHRPTKSVSSENTFRRDTGRFEDLAAEAKVLSADVANHLVRKGLAAGTIVLKLKTSDFKILTRNMRLENPTQRASVIEEKALALIRREVGTLTYRLIGVGTADLVEAAMADPPDLFD
ncbi:MAG: DNA polymerase IV [Hyphomicrobiaceae bacterium]